MGSSGGTLRRHEAWVSSLQRLVDAATIIFAQLLAHKIYGEVWREQTMTITVIGLLVYGFVAEVGGLYRPWRMETILRENQGYVGCMDSGSAGAAGVLVFTKTSTQYLAWPRLLGSFLRRSTLRCSRWRPYRAARPTSPRS